MKIIMCMQSPGKKAIELNSTTAKDVQQERGFDPVFFSQGLKSSLQLSNKKKFKIHVTKVKKQASFWKENLKAWPSRR